LGLTYPLDLAHTRLAADLSKKGQERLYTTTFEALNRTHVREGREGFYKGAPVGAIQSILTAMVFPLHDYAKGYLPDRYQRVGPALVVSLVSSLLFYPLDTVKRCQMLSGGPGQGNFYAGWQDCFVRVNM